jgi:hypothetical protein
MRYSVIILLGAMLAILMLVFSSCKTTTNKFSSKDPAQTNNDKDHQDIKINNDAKATSIITDQNPQQMLPPVMIYKTKGNYSKYVPVVLSADHTYIITYPDIKDIYYQGSFAYPTPLIGGYFLDNRGIDLEVAFLDYTYEQYQALGQTPQPDELLKHVLFLDPLTELYLCKCERDTALLNDMIRKNDFSKCTQLK